MGEVAPEVSEILEKTEPGKYIKEKKMSAKSSTAAVQAAPAQSTSEEIRAEDLFNKQNAYFASDATKTYEWRIDQLNRLTRMLKENFERFADASRKDFKTARRMSLKCRQPLLRANPPSLNSKNG